MSLSTDIGSSIKALIQPELPAGWNINVVGASEGASDTKQYPVVSITIAEPIPEIYKSKLFACAGQIMATVYQPDDTSLAELAGVSEKISVKLNEANLTVAGADSLALVISQTIPYTYNENEVTTTWEIIVVGRRL